MNISVKSYSPPPVSRSEILRYAGVRAPSEEIEKMLDMCLDTALDKLNYRLCFCQVPVTVEGNCVNLGFTYVSSEDLAKNLTDCGSAVIFAATLGQELDRCIARFSAISPAKALMLQAVGTERIEALCNIFNEDVKMQFGTAAPRFSPGYGDLPLELQRDIFTLLDCPRKIGLTLNNSLLMSPTKSVSAIIGIKHSGATNEY